MQPMDIESNGDGGNEALDSQHFPIPEEEKVKPILMEWEGVNFTVGDRKLLEDIHGFAQPYTVNAIMGPSGAGKTTLLDLLAQRLKSAPKNRTITGTVKLNGVPLGKQTKLQDYSCYVQQENSLIGILTVGETMRFNARLIGVAEARIKPILQELGLARNENTKVGNIFMKGLSGGEKRRLSIALELLSNPSILMLDEPTSGLDSSAALAVMKHVKRLALQGNHTIVASIHQPSYFVWDQIDYVTFLSRGKLVYFGKSGEDVVKFFDDMGKPMPKYANIPDFVLSLINDQFPGHMDVDKAVNTFQSLTHEKSPAEEFKELPDVHRFETNVFTRFLVLLERSFLELIRDPGIVGVRLAMYAMLSLLIGLMYLGLGNDKSDADINSRVAILFYVAAFMVFMSVAVLPFFMMQRDVFVRERCNGVFQVPEYVLARFFTAIPAVLVLAAVTTLLVVPMAGLNGWFIYLVDLFLSLLVAEGFMAVIAALVPHYIIGIALGAGCFGFFMLCEGYFKIRSDIPDYLIWGYHMGFHTYSFRVFMYNEFHPLKNLDSVLFADGEDVLEFYDMNDVNVGADLGVLLAMAIFCQLLLTYILQKYHTGKK